MNQEYRNDGFKIDAMRLDTETFENLLKDLSYIPKQSKDAENIEFEYEESHGIVANTEVIHDETISEPVPHDVTGLWREE